MGLLDSIVDTIILYGTLAKGFKKLMKRGILLSSQMLEKNSDSLDEETK